MPAPPLITELCNRYEFNRSAYRSEQYNEARLRQEFINPLFGKEGLGWDIYNSEGFAETYKDVVHEDAIKVGGSNKAPDYSFRIGGNRKFFLEAKKPRILLSNDVKSAFQLRRYGWSAKLPISVLTNFEEFAVYDCRIRPKESDAAGIGRVMILNYKQYLERWDELQSGFVA